MKASIRVGFAILSLLVPTQTSSVNTGWWVPDGVPLSQHRGVIEECLLVSDGSSGAIFAFQRTCQDNGVDIYAQRVDASGAVQWTDYGIAVCTAAGDQTTPALVSDGAGGAIIVWLDDRDGWDDIYAQRVNSSGVVQWTVNGVAVCPAAVPQGVVVSSDGVGGAIITWQDHRGSWYDVYAQRINGEGTIEWDADGVPVCTADWSQWHPTHTSDGAGGAIVVWEDGGIYAQRVNASGTVQWPGDGVAICATAGDYPAIVSDGAGGAVVTWVDGRRGFGALDVYAQRIDGSGDVQWEANGVAISTVPGTLTYGKYPQLVSDKSGGAIITWWDDRSGISDIYAQRVNGSGIIQWTENGNVICMGLGSQYHPQLTPDGVGGAVITWQDYRNGLFGENDVYAQRVNSSGFIQWVANGVAVCQATGDQEYTRIVSDAGTGAIITWADDRNAHVYTQRIDGNGTAQWTTDGVAVSTASNPQGDLQMISDGVGGAIITWVDGGYYTLENDIYAQRVNASLGSKWNADGVPVCTATGSQSIPRATSDGAGGAIIAWTDERGGYDDIYAQRINSSGDVQWTTNGIAVCQAIRDQRYPKIISDGAAGAIMVWDDSRASFVSHDIYAQRINTSGVRQWALNGNPVCTQTERQWPEVFELTPDGYGGAIITWQDSRNGNEDIYAQRIDALGNVKWTTNGDSICTAVEDQAGPQVVSDGHGGAVITWVDYRNGIDTDIYAQRIDALGVVQWGADGVAICMETGNQRNPRLVSDGAGGAIIAWEDDRNVSPGIYSQRVNVSGVVEWAVNGIAISTVPSYVDEPAIGSDGLGGAVVTWVDGGDIFAQHISATGLRIWAPSDLSVCTADGGQSNPQLTSDGRIIAWEDSRTPCSIAYIYANAIGEIVPTLLQSYAWTLCDGAVCLTWVLSESDEDARFSVWRTSHPGDQYLELQGVEIERENLSFNCTDKTCLPGRSYTYRVVYETAAIPRRTLFKTEPITIPGLTMYMSQNVPNPFNPVTEITVELPERTEVDLSVYDVKGGFVVRLFSGRETAGTKVYTWDGKDSNGNKVSSGVYFYRLKAGKKVLTKKMVLIK